MARYIDVDKLLNNLPNDLPYKASVKRVIMQAPTADVAEVKHGEWKEHFAFDCWHYDCPFCDDGYATKEKDKTPPNYCQNCGAKMDGKKEGTT